MVRTKERHVLVEIQLLERSSGARAPSSSQTIQEAVRHALSAASSSLKEGDTSKDAAAAAEPSTSLLQTRHYSRSAQLCLIRCTLAASRNVCAAIERVGFVQNRPIKLKIAGVFGSAAKARRVLGNRLEEIQWSVYTAGGDYRELNDSLASLRELQKSN